MKSFPTAVITIGPGSGTVMNPSVPAYAYTGVPLFVTTSAEAGLSLKLEYRSFVASGETRARNPVRSGAASNGFFTGNAGDLRCP